MLHTALSLVLFLFPFAYSPGPGNLFFAANGARFGFRATLPASGGYHLATWAVACAMGLGFLGVITRFPALFRAVEVAGALYVVLIAVRMFRAGAMGAGQAARPASALDGAVLLFLNPKAYVIIAVMFTRFLTPDEAAPVPTVLLIATVFTLNNLIAFCLWTLAGDALARLFRGPGTARTLNIAFATGLILVAVWMLRGG